MTILERSCNVATRPAGSDLRGGILPEDRVARAGLVADRAHAALRHDTAERGAERAESADDLQGHARLGTQPECEVRE